MKLCNASLQYKEINLKDPYKLSYGSLSSFKVITLDLHFEGGVSAIGEVVPLEGYSEETVDDVMEAANEWIHVFQNKEVGFLYTYLNKFIKERSCSVSLFTSALDMLFFDGWCDDLHSLNVPLVYPVSSGDMDVGSKALAAIDCGYGTIKVKLGKDILQDFATIDNLACSLADRDVILRFDANQGYTLRESREILQKLEDNQSNLTIELLEQPLPRSNWLEMEELVQVTDIPLMLDESIYDLDDVNRASDIGCKFVKFKLCKQGGVGNVVQLAKSAKDMGVGVVLGNGVATDISNFMELRIQHEFSDLFTGASESNGFLKLSNNLLYPQLRFMQGAAIYMGESI